MPQCTVTHELHMAYLCFIRTTYVTMSHAVYIPFTYSLNKATYGDFGRSTMCTVCTVSTACTQQMRADSAACVHDASRRSRAGRAAGVSRQPVDERTVQQAQLGPWQALGQRALTGLAGCTAGKQCSGCAAQRAEQSTMHVCACEPCSGSTRTEQRARGGHAYGVQRVRA